METQLVPAGVPVAEGSATTYDRAFRLIAAFKVLGTGPQRLHDVALMATLLPSTAHRILQAGIRAGFIRKASRGRYSLVYPIAASDAHSEIPPASDMYRRAWPLTEPIENILGALHRATGQTVMLHVPILVGVPTRHCLVYLADEPDALMDDAERHLVTDVVFSAPLDVDSQGEAMLAHLIPEASMDARMRGILDARFNRGPSPVPGWGTVTAPVARGGRLVAAVSLTARNSWISRHRDPAVTEVVRTAARLGDERPAARPSERGGVRSLMRRGR